ncbi:hypothetical protein BVC80_1709g13 [Macleaya cordata]|uniref:Uncharacterized protein n=1 Tax=Macleaya cordata TaxID=56857 RepID=A0A200Q6S8_MACCD|nr:hypothetical protein BVC80_1709g13 [Macleaya cordata]
MDNNRVSSISVSDPSFANPRSGSKFTGDQRRLQSSMELSGRTLEPCRKRVKMRDIESVLQSEARIETRRSESSINKETSRATNQFHFGLNEEIPKVTEDFFPNHVGLKNKTIVAKKPSSDVKPTCIDENSKHSLPAKQDKDGELGSKTSRGPGFDLNAEDVCNLGERDPFYPYKVNHQLKSREDSECGSSTGPLEENDSLRRWKEMKQNGFLSSSSSHGCVPVPKRRGRKSKSDTLKKKMELAKKEEINRFSKIAAPSGLLTGLNPGIITHVRNSKQVHSIIEALVRSEKTEHGSRSRTAGGELIRETKDTNDQRNYINDSEAHRFGLSHENELPDTLKGTKDAIYFAYKRVCGDTSVTTNFGSENDMLALKLSSSITMPSETRSSVSTEESASQASITSLSVKAATVASQWLELLYQDIRGRLAALERSKKRLQAVIQIELPLLMSREFSSEQENSSYSSKSSTGECLNTANPDIHRTKWFTLFGQMEKALSEEGKQLNTGILTPHSLHTGPELTKLQFDGS